MKNHILILLFSLIFLTNCGYKYTVNIHESLQGRQVTNKSFLVLPIEDMEYNPPSTCFFPADRSQQPLFEEEWNRRMQENLPTTFPNQKWHFYHKNDDLLEKYGSSLSIVLTIAQTGLVSEPVYGMGSADIIYMNNRYDSQLQDLMKKLNEEQKIDYVVVFVGPALTGEIVTTYTGGPHGGSFSSTKYFTSRLQVQVWDCATGNIMICTGGWNKASGFCFFISPEEMSIKGNIDQLMDNLNNIIARIIRKSNDSYAGIDD
jgi:hypothetical protein